jgi:hypothetical protein
MKVKFNKNSFFKFSSSESVSPILEIKEKSGQYQIRIEFGLNISLCKNFKIQNFSFNVYNGELTENARPSFDSEDSLRRGLESSIKDFNDKIIAIQNERNSELIHSQNITLIDNLIPKSLFESQQSVYPIKYFKYLESELSYESLNQNTPEKPIISSYDFCLSMIKNKNDPALYKGVFPLKGVEETSNPSIKYIDLGQWKAAQYFGKYSEDFINTEFYPVNFTFDFNKDVLDNKLRTTKKITIEIISKNIDNIICSIEKFTLNLEDTIDYIDENIIQNVNNNQFYYRKLNRDIKFDSSYELIDIPTNNNIMTSYPNGLIRCILSGVHKLTVFTTDSNIREAQSINLFSINKIPFYTSKNSENNNLEIIFGKIPRGITAVGLEKRNATKKEKFYKFTKPEFVDTGSSKTFLDVDFKNGHLYEYRPYYIDEKGHTKIASNTVEYQHKIIKKNFVSSISNLNREIRKYNDLNYPVIYFSINTTLNNDGKTVLQNFLEKNGYTLNSLGVQDNNYEFFQDSFLFQITRYNMTTGEFELLGTTIDNTYVDDTASPANSNTTGAKPLNAFHDYIYFVKIAIRNFESLVSTQVAKNLNNALSKIFEYNSYRFSQKNMNNDNILLNKNHIDESISSDAITENFMKYYTGVEESIVSFSGTSYPVINDLNVEAKSFGYNRLTWTIDGEMRLIDHFRIYAETDGIYCLIATVHPHVIEENGTMKHRYDDYNLYNRIGKITYTVEPVLLNFTESPGKVSRHIIKQNNLPTFLR